MEKTLANKSGIFLKKTKFFSQRLLVYFSFLLLPVWIQKSLEINIFVQTLMMLLFLMFMAAQWYLLGKEIDHRLKIYFRANSTVDRILYRLIIGFSAILLIFNLFSVLPQDLTRHFFWGFFIIFGLFYSWPTRGKIIQESVSTQFSEFKFLDNFEKTILILSISVFLISLPNFPFLSNLETYKLIIDPEEKINIQLWNYLHLNFIPFRRFPHLINLGWSMHFYFVGLGFYLLAFYGVCRFFISRRLSILALFALISTWSFSIFLKRDPYYALVTTFSLVWLWAVLWSVKSSTYRSGLMFGLICYLGTLLNYHNAILFPIGLVVLYFSFLKESTDWFRLQFVKYSYVGLILILISVLMNYDISFSANPSGFFSYFQGIGVLVKRKAFFALSFIGVTSLLISYVGKKFNLFSVMNIDYDRLKQLLTLIFILIFLGVFYEKDLIKNFGSLWIIVFLSVYPLEWLFQSISRLRSKRNIIFVVYILICLLDSHLEGRFRIFYNFLTSPPEIIELNAREK